MAAGRRTKLTKELIDDAEQLLKAGNYVTTVCDYLGINQSTWYRWIQDGEKARSGLKREFCDMVKKATAHAEIKTVAVIQEAAQHDWKAAMTYLERKFPDRWGKKRQSHTAEEEALRIQKLRAEIQRAQAEYLRLIDGEGDEEFEDDGFIDALNYTAGEVWDDDEDDAEL